MHKLPFLLKVNIGTAYQKVLMEMTLVEDNNGNDKFWLSGRLLDSLK